ncbi:hypothetical protein ACFPTO_07155 [Paraburkholderia denitrificans]|uniref:Lipoprotein n=1 Tax=Paraburkholderia denitrificans TaxID=694025 RepID=A0ABW0J6B3_9BURK
MTRIEREAAAPDSPASRDSVFLTRRPGVPRILLRRSAALHLVLAVGIGVATAAVHTSLAPWLGAARAIAPTLAFLALCGLAAVAWHRAQPAVIEMGPDFLAAYGKVDASGEGGAPGEGSACRAGSACTARGRLTGASQWGTSLLALTVEGSAGRTAVLVAADALEPDAFRTLAIRARCAAGR